jgi:hypothetical protein
MRRQFGGPLEREHLLRGLDGMDYRVCAASNVFGVTGPVELPCLPLRLHVAQKLHGMTLPPRRGKRNERFRDPIDLLLMEELVTDYAGLREACESVSRTPHARLAPAT